MITLTERIALTERESLEGYIQENIGVLEQCLAEISEEYRELHSRKKELDFGKWLNLERLREILPAVLTETENFLDVHDVPKFSYGVYDFKALAEGSVKAGLFFGAVTLLMNATDGLDSGDLLRTAIAGILTMAAAAPYGFTLRQNSYYNSDKAYISFGFQRTSSATHSTSHEYTHHIQATQTDLPMKSRNPIVEGHATGTGLAISRIFAEKTNDMALKYDILNSAYLLLGEACKDARKREKTAQKPRPGQRKMPILERMILTPANYFRKLGYNAGDGHYYTGTAAMLIAEKKEGTGVYAKAAHNDFSFLRA